MSDLIYTPENYGLAWIHGSECYSLVEFPVNAVTMAVSGDVVTVTFSVPHGIKVGEFVRLKFDTVVGDSIGFQVTEVPSPSELKVDSYSVGIPDGSYTGIAQQQQPVIMPMTDYVEVGDKVNFTAKYWDYDDENQYMGPVRRMWSACQMAAANLPGNFGDGPATSGIWTGIFTASVAGVFRIWLNTTFPNPFGLAMIEANPYLRWTIGSGSSQSTAIKLMTGDRILYRTDDPVSFIFCPSSYP